MKYQTLDGILIMMFLAATAAMLSYFITKTHDYTGQFMLFGFWPIFGIRQFLWIRHNNKPLRQGDDDARSNSN